MKHSTLFTFAELFTIRLLKNQKEEIKMPRNCNFCPILDLVTLNVFVCVSKVITGMKIIKSIRPFSFRKTAFLKSGFVVSVDDLELN